MKSVDTSFPINVGNDGTGNYGLGYWGFPFGTTTNGLSMDDLGIWRRALQDQEVCAIYNAGLAGGDFTTVTTNKFTLIALPRITTQPSNRFVNVGSNANFSIAADGSATLRYQWWANGAPLAGRTNASFTLTNVQSAQVGSYWAVVTNAGGGVTSSIVTLALNTIPVVETQPQGQILVAGSEATFFVEAGGASPLRYQWKLGATSINGATNAVLVRSNVQLGDAGNYTVVITNGLGAVTSAVATLTIAVPPSITLQPVSQVTTQELDVVLSAQATGTPAPFYQWRLNGAAISGATNATLNLLNVQNRDAGNYTVVVTNIAGSATSVVATLTVALPEAHPHVLWLSTQGSTIATGQSPLSWSSNSIVSFNFPGLSYGPNATAGTFRKELDFLPPRPIRAFYYVNSTNRVGNPGTDFELWPGDLLVVFNVTTPTTFGTVPNVLRSDVLVYRPGPGRDYQNGTFAMLLNNPLGSGCLCL